MATTIRTYRHAPDVATDPTGTLVDTETDADGGAFSVSVATTGWAAGFYEITASAQNDGDTESLKSSPLSLSVAVLGASDDFTGADGTLLATHDANWASLDASYVVTDAQLNGAGQVQATANFGRPSGRYTASTSDTSQIVIKAKANTAADSEAGAAVRADASGNYYACRVYGITGGNYTNVNLYRVLAGVDTWIAGAAYTGSLSADHTVRMIASGTGATVTVTVDIDGANLITFNDTDANRRISGNPGFRGYAQGNQNNAVFDDWRDY